MDKNCFLWFVATELENAPLTRVLVVGMDGSLTAVDVHGAMEQDTIYSCLMQAALDCVLFRGGLAAVEVQDILGVITTYRPK